LALTGLLPNQRYTAFLRPEFGYVLGLGTFALFGFVVVEIGDLRPRRFGVAQGLRALILLLPLAYLFNARGASLDAYAFQNRSLGLPNVIEPETDDRPAAPGRVDTPAQAGDVDAPASKPVTILDLYYAPRAYEGKRVKLTGMLHKNDPQVEADFGKSLPVVFRFVITCCAADASPVAVLVDGDDLPDLPESAWVEVAGTFRIQEKDGRRVPIVATSIVTEKETPKQPYLY
jgi:uncharacterized repeat protein (TIGR03943 family)